jgi:hypothetical protein
MLHEKDGRDSAHRSTVGTLPVSFSSSINQCRRMFRAFAKTRLYYRSGEGFTQTVAVQALARIRRTVLACQAPLRLLGTSVQIQARIERHEKADQNYIEQGIRLV